MKMECETAVSEFETATSGPETVVSESETIWSRNGRFGARNDFFAFSLKQPFWPSFGYENEWGRAELGLGMSWVAFPLLKLWVHLGELRKEPRYF